jgi:hypothetical protein
MEAARQAREQLVNTIDGVNAADTVFQQAEIRLLTALKNVNYGRAAEDKKTFCWYDIEPFLHKATEFLEPVQSKICALLNASNDQSAISPEHVLAASMKGGGELEARILVTALRQVHLGVVKQVDGAENWAEARRRTLRTAVEAASPMIQCNYLAAGVNPKVFGCYVGFNQTDQALIQPPGPGDSQQSKSGRPINPHSDDVEITRFFHGICLNGISTARRMGVAYRQYMADLKKSSTQGERIDRHNLFRELEGWPAVDEPVPETTIGEEMKLWAIGLMLGKILEPTDTEKAALKRSKGRAIAERRNYLFENNNYYYLQPIYDADQEHESPAYIKMGRGREVAFETFKNSLENLEMMRRWILRAEDECQARFTTQQLTTEARKYRETLGSSELERAEAKIILDFENNPRARFDRASVGLRE